MNAEATKAGYKDEHADRDIDKSTDEHTDRKSDRFIDEHTNRRIDQ